VWKNQAYAMNAVKGDGSREFDQQYIPFYACPKCLGDPVKYCS
jgi:hypothetical protein